MPFTEFHSGDGTLSVMDVRSKNPEPFAQSEDQEDELLSIVAIKGYVFVSIWQSSHCRCIRDYNTWEEIRCLDISSERHQHKVLTSSGVDSVLFISNPIPHGRLYVLF